MILGLPSNDSELTVTPGTQGYSVKLKSPPSFVYVKRLKRRPTGFSKTKFNRFYGKVGGREIVGDIKGMSGGPIFVIGESTIGVVALQSKWDPTRRIISGCPLSVFVPLLEAEIAKRPLGTSQLGNGLQSYMPLENKSPLRYSTTENES